MVYLNLKQSREFYNLKKQTETMVDSRVTVKISYKDAFLLNESSAPLETCDLNELIAVLKDTQQKTNECLTKLTKETVLVASAEEKSDVSEEYSDDDEDSSVGGVAADNNENDVSPKRAKLKN